MLKKIFLLFILAILSDANAQLTGQDDTYKYYVDLNNVSDGKLTIELITPKISGSTAQFKLPAMVPGTYSVYDFGRYVSDLKAFDESGIELNTSKPDVNTWEISDAGRLHRITYKVRESFGDTSQPRVFEPAGTCIEEGKVFAFNNHGFFGYFEGMIDNDFTLNFRKPQGFFGATSMNNVSRSETEEVFSTPGYFEVVDNPILFTVPDTVTINFDEMSVLVSVYSPGKGLRAKDFYEPNKKLLEAIREHLGGRLPADKYTFLYFFAANFEGGSGGFGALEHKQSSFYYMPDVPAQAKSVMINQMEGTNAHEFYHIVTPLNLHSEEIGNFDYGNPVMSKHLWLYEGVTEYFADYIRLSKGLIDMNEFMDNLKEKLNSSMRHNDSLAFTEMSKGALDEYKKEYINVYSKGALIGLCLDILIRKESDGRQGLQDVINTLTQKYGKDRPFKDDELFSDIEVLTSPKVREFIDMYIDGPNRIPYDKFLSEIGLQLESTPYQVADVGGLEIGFNAKTFRLKINKLTDPDNELVKQLGLLAGDELISFNGTEINFMNASDIFGSAKKQMKAGDKLDLVVSRASGGSEKEVELSAVLDKTKTNYDFEVKEVKNPSDSQNKLRNAWLGKN